MHSPHFEAKYKLGIVGLLWISLISHNELFSEGMIWRQQDCTGSSGAITWSAVVLLQAVVHETERPKLTFKSQGKLEAGSQEKNIFYFGKWNNRDLKNSEAV